MGQYYRIIVRKGDNDTVYDRRVPGSGYVCAKLLEFSWWGNPFCRSLARMLMDSPGKVCFVGDYAETDECRRLGFSKVSVWGEDVECAVAPGEYLELDGVKYLVDADKCQYVDLAKYKAASEQDGWTLFPLAILAALGNGRGGGDYKEDPLAGSWAFDTVYFTNCPPPERFEEIEPVFKL